MEHRTVQATKADAGSASSVADFLEKWPWFHTLSEELRKMTLETSLELTVPASEYVARAGEPSSYWYGVISGHLQMYIVGPAGDETTLYYLREGEWCGDGSLLKRELMQYDLRSLTSAHLCLIPASSFNILRSSSIEFSNFLCDVMNARMGEFVGMLVASRLLGPEKRVAKALLMLAKNGQEEDLRLSIHQHDLALICGLSRQRVNMALASFKQDGIVRTEGTKGYLIVHIQRLRSYIGTTDC
ncbi:cAMP-binding protein [Acidovorax sp. CF316]|uniref:Crp/Fnr family transcriptional regulator n=1 Tax=Acidovorax sp. CF316 TaxID=1144317 RepID=UPI00026BD352|nr:Crp/Fnr family transcriptional regulator [Acidovorax sp. CF316]EJE53367.1 cAMP-binding protein [Acidovorax sp. CF316]